MPVAATCFCDEVLEAEDDDALVLLAQEHLQHAHTLAVGPVASRNWIERQRQLPPVPEQIPALGAVTTRPVSPEAIPDFLELFDRTGFSDNPGWAACYCMFHHLDPAEFEERPWRQNRDEMVARLRAGATTGVLAYVDGTVAGWVNASRLAAYPPHRHGDERDETTGAIVCFVVAPAYRRQGLGTLLLDAACELLAGAGLRGVEAYPAAKAGSAAAAYHGTREMYARAGFAPVGEKVMYRDL